MPGYPMKFIVQGKKYSNSAELARAFGINPKLFYDRIKAGWSTFEALELEKRKKRVYKTISISGKTFSSVKAACNHYGLNAKKVSKRLRDGWTNLEAFELKERVNDKLHHNNIGCTVLGMNFKSKTERDYYFGLKRGLFEKRIDRGWTEAQAAGVEKKVRTKPKWKKTKTINGITYPDADIGEFKLYQIQNLKNGKLYIGITITPLDVRLRGHFAQAFNPKKFNGKLHNAIRKYGPNNFEIKLIRNDAKDFYQLGHQEIKEIKKRNTVEDGYNISPGGEVGTGKSLKVGRLTFHSISSAAEYFGLDERNLAQRLRNGWSPKEAVMKRGGRTQTFDVDGKSYASFRAACREYGLDWKKIHARIYRNGWTAEQAFELEPRVKRGGPKEFEIEGVVYPSFRAACRAYNLDWHKIYRRHFVSGWSKERAFEIITK